MEESKAFKNFINHQIVQSLANEIKAVYPEFDKKKFCRVSAKFPLLELKARVLAVTAELEERLPKNYLDALRIIVLVIKNDNLRSFSLWPFSEYISQFGLDHFDESMKAMYELTQRFTSEFAVRSFLLKDHKKVLKYFNSWAKDENVHVRRWVSEGARPILPWGGKIPLFISDPKHTLGLLEKLKFDDELYVRKSVANHLNDITKNHPQTVIDLLSSWEKNCPEIHQAKIEWIKKHALRTLIKKGHPGALKLMGVTGKLKLIVNGLKLNKSKFTVGDNLTFEFRLLSQEAQLRKIIIDYGINFMKANGQKSVKIFKLKNAEIAAGAEMMVKKSHSLRPITTMKFYPGVHHGFIQINGVVVANFEFDLKV